MTNSVKTKGSANMILRCVGSALMAVTAVEANCVPM